MSNAKVHPGSHSPILILGCQRSGTTWLANIFDASPDTIFFMEPFAPPTGNFPELPSTNTFLEQGSAQLDKLLRDEMPGRLLRHKWLFFQRSVIDPKWFKLERLIAIFVQKKRYRRIPSRIRRRIQKFYAINFNRMDETYPIFPKNGFPSIWVIKELRLAGKLPAFQRAVPLAQYVVIIRHPAATVHSILKWFERNRLGELRADLENYVEMIQAQSVAEPYTDGIKLCRAGNLAHKVALYWRISYETLFKQLAGNPRAHFVVYEQLATDPRKTLLDLFMKTGIPWSRSIDEYISYSTGREVESASPIMTIRNSKVYYQSWLSEISDGTQRAVMDVVKGSFLMSYFEPYYPVV